jgi:hypothetical protein
MVARRQQIDWPELLAWVEREGIDLSVVRRLKEKAERG